MCLAIPARVVELLPDAQAVVELGGVRKEISVALLEGLAPGDYVIVHVGYALARLDPQEAQRTLDLFAQAGLVAQAGVDSPTGVDSQTGVDTPADAPGEGSDALR